MTQFFCRHFRSIVAAIFGSMIVTAILVVWLPYHRERQFAQAIENTEGGRATFAYFGPDWVPLSFRDKVHVFDRIDSVALYGEDVPNHVVDNLKSLRHLESLYLAAPNYDSDPLKGFHHMPRLSNLSVVCTPLNDKDWDEILNTTSLRAIMLSQMKISEYGIANLGKMTSLRTLALDQSPISDSDLKQLKGLTSLTYLSLRETSIRGNGLENVQGMSALFFLILTGSKITDDSLVHIKPLIGLKVLELQGTPVGDAGLEHLVSTNLSILDLSGTQVSDAGLGFLCEMKQLQSLNLSNTKVTEAGVEKLRQARLFLSVRCDAK